MKWLNKHVYLNNFVRGILAGAAIGVGGLLNIMCLSIGQKVLGGFCFSVGLITVCFCGLHLYTGKIGYVTENNKKFLLSLFFMYIGNIVGAVGFGYILRACHIYDSFMSNTVNSIGFKKILDLGSGVGQTWINMLAMSIFCGCMVFIGVDIYKKNKGRLIVQLIGLILAVATFVILGNEHCIADMFYMAVSNVYATKFGEAVLALLLCTLGNSIGGIAMYFVLNNSTVKKYI